ncbi:hypothetical protein H6802_02520 [Candidatus Nomurabacteria bacterium]|uniref:Uncharacterized protein n=1 Tax=candidate division WWE3 bacterium TaxID=2053526 RepID=A0A955IW50_UNCKA|nr:hypothetical protein [candidate division WWE3 bacterium]MCB9823808.1 hypothetical protein [Candidatus Nomurabacteria bacterium]MCB9826786.1 hypothetical protein [Candidatus Nomurabacteria bacterium]MCB9827603.1 hypothetical protein [Candidatus Nomurabacteria bacterium]HXK52609.1 hypothetical protein [bacterium]
MKWFLLIFCSSIFILFIVLSKGREEISRSFEISEQARINAVPFKGDLDIQYIDSIRIPAYEY